MISVRIKIGEEGTKYDTFTKYGFVYLDSDKRVGSETKGFEATSYPEEEGEHIIPKTVDAPFDYKVKFFVQADSIGNANDKIKAFNEDLYTEEQDSDVKTFNQVTFYNDYKRHKIVGYPQPISLATDFWQDQKSQLNDIVVIEWTIRVTKPSLCEYTTPFTDDTAD